VGRGGDGFVASADGFSAEASSALWGVVGRTWRLYRPVTERSLSPRRLNVVMARLNRRRGWRRAEENELEQLKRQIEKTDREIDERVYELYGITEKEKKIIDGTTPLQARKLEMDVYNRLVNSGPEV